MIVSFPAVVAVTKPVVGDTKATVNVLLLQVPPVVRSLNRVVSPTQIPVAPETGNGSALTVTGMEMLQPVGSV